MKFGKSDFARSGNSHTSDLELDYTYSDEQIGYKNVLRRPGVTYLPYPSQQSLSRIQSG